MLVYFIYVFTLCVFLFFISFQIFFSILLVCMCLYASSTISIIVIVW